MLKQINDNISFQARFLFNGTKRETNSFAKFIATEIADSDCPKSKMLVKRVSNNDAIVLTSFHCDSPIQISDIINASSFYDKNRKQLKFGIIDFDPIWGFYEKINSKMKNGITSFFKTTHLQSEKIKLRRDKVPKLDFNQDVNIEKALDIANNIAKLRGDHNINKYKEVVRQHNNTFKNLKINGVAGVGQESIIFNIDKKLVLKFSMYPCYPQNVESFDLPILKAGWLPSRNKTLYYCIAPRGKNLFETKIKRRDVLIVMNEIEKNNYTLNDIFPSDYKQIVLYKNKPYLCDYNCARLSSGESRLVQRDYYDLG